MKFLFSLAVLAASWTACAQGTSAIQGYLYNVSGSVSNATAGWTFQTTTGLTVTNLGCFADVFVHNPDVTAIQVGLWAPGGSLLASDTVTPSSALSLSDQTRYESITPVFLTSGQLYHVGVFYAGWLGLDLPGPSTGGSIYAGPNFLYYKGGIPEPSSWLLLGLGGLLLAARRNHQRP